MTGPDARIVAVVGPTAAGKSTVAMAAAKRCSAEIVAVDAFTVYRQMSIGTAKPSVDDRNQVPHHMVDCLDVEQTCTVEWFQQSARDRIDDAISRGVPVILVGGSGLYFRAVVDPLRFPPTDPALRQRINEAVMADLSGSYRQLCEQDPAAAAKIDPGNVRRITRALEVMALTGEHFSSFRAAWDDYVSVYDGLTVIGVTHPPAKLADRISGRVRAMADAGWVEECTALLDRDLSRTAEQAIGYAEVFTYLRGGSSDPITTMWDAISVRTRQFAARQRRWFTKDPRVSWTDHTVAIERVVEALEGPPRPTGTP